MSHQGEGERPQHNILYQLQLHPYICISPPQDQDSERHTPPNSRQQHQALDRPVSTNGQCFFLLLFFLLLGKEVRTKATFPVSGLSPLLLLFHCSQLPAPLWQAAARNPAEEKGKREKCIIFLSPPVSPLCSQRSHPCDWDTPCAVPRLGSIAHACLVCRHSTPPLLPPIFLSASSSRMRPTKPHTTPVPSPSSSITHHLSASSNATRAPPVPRSKPVTSVTPSVPVGHPLNWHFSPSHPPVHTTNSTPPLRPSSPLRVFITLV